MTSDEPVIRKDGEWYRGPDGFWYCWPSRDPYPMPPVDQTSGGPADVGVHAERATAGSVLEHIDARTARSEFRARNRRAVPIALGGLVLVAVAVVVALAVSRGDDAGTDELALVGSEQTVTPVHRGLTRTTDTAGDPLVSYAVAWRNRSRTDYALDVTITAVLVDAAGATVREITQRVAVVPPGQFAALGQELDDVPTAQSVTAVDAQVGSWSTQADGIVFTVEDVLTKGADGLIETSANVIPTTNLTALPMLHAVAVHFDADNNAIGGSFIEIPALPDTEAFEVSILGHPLPGIERSRVYLMVVA